MSETKYICCICGKEIIGYGNDPWPVKEDGRCCDKCNYTQVLQERIKQSNEYWKNHGTGDN